MQCIDMLDFREPTLRVSGTLSLTRALASSENVKVLRVLHIAFPEMSSRPIDHVYDHVYAPEALAEVYQPIQDIQLLTFGLHRVHVVLDDLPAVAGLFHTIKDSLMRLTLALNSWDLGSGIRGTDLLFQAISGLSTLRVLALPR